MLNCNIYIYIYLVVQSVKIALNDLKNVECGGVMKYVEYVVETICSNQKQYEQWKRKQKESADKVKRTKTDISMADGD